MPRPVRITEAEWEVMEALWERSPATARDVVERLRDRRNWSPRTVKTLLARLVRKGALSFETRDRCYRYRPRLRRAEALRAEGRSLLERLAGGSVSPLVATFLREGRLTREEIAELRHLLREREDRR